MFRNGKIGVIFSKIINWSSNIKNKFFRRILELVTGIDIRRDLFYKKELSLQVSCSYGPGRYDSEYEEKGGVEETTTIFENEDVNGYLIQKIIELLQNYFH